MDNLYNLGHPIYMYWGVVFMGKIVEKLIKFKNDAANITIGKVIALVIVIYVIVALLPDALEKLIGMNSTGNATIDSLLQALAVIITLVIFAGIAKEAE